MQNVQLANSTRANIRTEADLERAIANFLRERSATVAEISTEFNRGAQTLKAIDRLRTKGAIVSVGRCPATYTAA